MDIASIQAAKGSFGKAIYKFGFNTAISTAEETVWDGGGVYTYPASAAVASLVSASAADDLTGTGAQKVTVEGLDANWKFQSVEVDMDGTSAVATTETWRRIYRAYVTQAGSGEVNAGNITISTGGTTRAQISADQGQTLMAVYTVPDNLTGYVTGWSIGSGATSGNKYLHARLIVRRNNGVIQTKAKTTLNNTNVVIPFDKAIVINPRDDIEIRAQTSSGTDEVSGTFSLVMQST